MATVVATFFESCVSREILGGDRAGPWLEVLAPVASAGAAGLGASRCRRHRSDGSSVGKALSRRLLGRRAGTSRVAGGGAAEPFSPLPHPCSRSPQKPPPLLCFGFPFLKCGHLVTCLSRGNGAICQRCLETKATSTSREWLSLIQMRGTARLRLLRGSLWFGKEVTLGEGTDRYPTWWGACPSGHRGRRLPFPFHSLSQLCAAGAGTGPAGPLWGETGPLAPPGAALRRRS